MRNRKGNKTMMREYEKLFSDALWKKLKCKIIGKIFVKVTRNDELLVVITREDELEELEFKTFVPDFSDKLVNGLTTDYVAYEVIKEYRKFIMERMNERYFYQD